MRIDPKGLIRHFFTHNFYWVDTRGREPGPLPAHIAALREAVDLDGGRV